MKTVPRDQRMSWWAWAAVAGFFVGWLLFGAVVVYRTALIERPQGDLCVFLMAGWAVREAPDHLYDYTDHNGFHYCYPPLFAVLMSPLGHTPPPPGGERGWLVSSAAVFYGVSLLCLFAGVHWLAGTLEPMAKGPSWWLLRTSPILACAVPIGHTLARGQVNLIVLALLCGGAALLIRGRRVLAGCTLAGAACLKVFPAFLLLYPLWRRDWRGLVGWAAGLVVGLAVIPVVALGPARTMICYREFVETVLEPGLHLNEDPSRAKELIETTATDSQSFLAVIHNTLHLDRDRWHRPPDASPAVRWLHLGLGGLMTTLTLLAARGRRLEGTAVVLFLGALTLCMLLLSPVCHTHYFALSLPLVMALLAREWRRPEGRIRLGVWALLILNMVGNTLPLLPGCEVLKDAGSAMYATLALWAVACLGLRQAPAAAKRVETASLRAAA